MRSLVGDRGHRRGQHRGDRGPAEEHQRQDENRQHRHLDFLRLDLLADIFRRAADHEAGDEDGDDDEDQHAVEAGADAADDDLAELHVDQRDHAAKRREAIVHGIDGAAGGSRGDHREQSRQRHAEAHLLAFHVRRIEPEACELRIAGCLGPIGDEDACDEDNAHGGEDGPALTLIADHAAEHIGERGADGEDRHDLEQIGERRRILERVRRVGVEEAAAIGAEHLDGNLRRDRSDGDGLLGAFQRRRVDIGAQASAACPAKRGTGRKEYRSAAGCRGCNG